jgi:hypothetical protein
MGIFDCFVLNGVVNWDAVSTISTTILTAALICITWWYAAQIEKRAKKDRMQEEMDLLISPLYSKSHSELKSIFFMKGSPGYYDSGRNREQAYFQFWDNIRRYQYLGPEYLHSALEFYFTTKSHTVGDNSRDSAYDDAEKKLFKEIERRYSELQKIL